MRLQLVMAALVAAIDVFSKRKTWMRGTSPRMTRLGINIIIEDDPPSLAEAIASMITAHDVK